jgi:VWFA-related protein
MGRLLTVLACLLSSIALAHADALTQANAEPQLVHLNIVATDNHGAPVNDLSSSDLQISDDGKPQQILYFRRIDRRLPPPPALAPNQLANRTPATIPHATVILLDFMNERLATSAYAAHQLVHYLQSLESAD